MPVLRGSARLLEDTLADFSVKGEVRDIRPGPVVTTFELKPDAGVKYSKVTGLSDDLCLAMQAESVLIDRIPGKATVGIQIPNPNREAISLRELLESDAYMRSTSKLAFAMGKTIHGEPYIADLATMPHLPAWISMSCRDGGTTCAGQPVTGLADLVRGHAQVVAIGVNCTKPEFVSSLLGHLGTDVPLVAYPNAGRVWDGEKRVWLGDGEQVLPAQAVREWVALGARLVGGCCGLGPAAVTAISRELAELR